MDKTLTQITALGLEWPGKVYVGTITSSLPRAKIAPDDPSHVIVDLGEEGVSSDVSVGFKRPQCLILP